MTEAKPVEPESAAIVPFPKAHVPSAPQERYQGASQLTLTEEEEQQLLAPFADDDHDILPTGEVYVSHVHVRRRLNEVIGIGQWSLMRAGDYVTEKIGKRTVLYREYHLYVRGHFVSEAVGESEYYEDNDRSSWATASEVLRSNAITRVCKDPGIAAECWDRHWTERWKREWAVRVWVEKKGDKGRTCWRRKDAAPLAWEQRVMKEREAPPQHEEQPVAPKASVEIITTDQATVLVNTAREHKLPRGVMNRIIQDEGGVADLYQIPKDRYERVIAAVRKYR